MKEYLEQVMHQTFDQYQYTGKDKLPLGLRNAFDLKILRTGEQEFILAEPVEEMNLTELRKMRMQLERYTGCICGFYLKKVNWYAAPKMVEEGIPFVWEGHQVYLPFMGMILQKNVQRTLKCCSVISFLTQKLLIKALYDNWQDVSAARAAELLDVSRMSITRCYDEIESLGMPFLKMYGRSRRFSALEEKKKMWEVMDPFLRDPVIHVFRPDIIPEGDMILSGTSALSEYSMLGENTCPVYAVRKDQVKAMGLKELREVPPNEEPACIIHEVGYVIPFGKSNAVDPLSLTLMLTDEDLADPRVEICINEMLEELVW